MSKYLAENRHATWLELFFDLVFVASIGVITHHLAHVHDGHLDAAHALLFPLEFVPVWWIWATHTLFANRYDADGKPHRLASLAIMMLMVTMSGFLGAGLADASGLFVWFYVAIRIVLAGTFLTARGPDGGARCAQTMGRVVALGAAIAASALLFESPLRQIVFLGSIAFEMVAAVVISLGASALPVHRSHLVERVGLLSIILLGESVISLVAGLRGIAWGPLSLAAAVTGFLMLCAIWWIYFDSFEFLERAKRDRHGFVLLYSHVLLLLGLGVLASTIGHAVRADTGMADFRTLLISGMALFYLGKQIGYFHVFPPWRVNILVNSAICIAITVASTFLPRAEYALMGATLGMLIYSLSNFRWTLPKDVSRHLESS